MKIFSSCCNCCVCDYSTSVCVAGNGDNYFQLASKEEIISRLKSNKFCSDPHDKTVMIETLKNEYNYDYIAKETNETFIKDLEDIKEEFNKRFSEQSLGGLLYWTLYEKISIVDGKISECINKYKLKEDDEEKTKKNSIIGAKITNTPDSFTVYLKGE